MILRAAFACFLVSVTCAVGVVAAQQNPGCSSCHDQQGEEHASGVHRGALACTTCHGGVADAATREAAHSGDYRGPLSRLDVPLLCGACHADVMNMAVAGLPSSALREYAAGGHGHAVLVRGDPRAAVCTDCHRTHEPHRVADVESLSHPKNQAQTCGKCHADAAVMDAVSLPTTTCDRAASDVHGRAVMRLDPQAPSCASCHDGHVALRALPTDAGVCGRCHERELESMRASPHGRAPAAGVTCVNCHAPHGVEPLTHTDLEAACGSCHDSESPAAAVGRRVGEQLAGIGAAARAGFASIEVGPQSPAARAELSALRVNIEQELSRAKAAAHSLDEATLKRIADRVGVARSEAARLVEEKSEVARTRRLVSFAVGVGVAALVAVLMTLRAVAAFRRKVSASRATPSLLAWVWCSVSPSAPRARCGGVWSYSSSRRFR